MFACVKSLYGSSFHEYVIEWEDELPLGNQIGGYYLDYNNMKTSDNDFIRNMVQYGRGMKNHIMI